jgi:hypothetical protein
MLSAAKMTIDIVWMLALLKMMSFRNAGKICVCERPSLQCLLDWYRQSVKASLLRVYFGSVSEASADLHICTSA